jgi:hypothetical protein
MTQSGAHAISASTSGCAPLRLGSRLGFAATSKRSSAIFGAMLIELRSPVDRAPRRCQRQGIMSETIGLTSHKSSCNCTGCGMLRAGVCINCAEKTAALILESGRGELAVEPCSGACREAIELYFSTPPERWRAPLTR